MTSEHEDLQADLPAYAARRLEPARHHAIQGHVAACLECREAVAAFSAIAAGIARTGDSLFAPHPASAALRRLAQGEGAGDATLRRHIELCAACALEVDAWRQVAMGVPSARASRARGSLPRLALATAAGLLLGILLSWLYRGVPSATPPHAPPAASQPAPLSGDSLLDLGQPVLYVLPEAHRGAEPTRADWELDPGDPWFGVAFPIAIPDGADGATPWRIEIRRIGGEVAWSTEMTVSRLRDHMRSAE